MSVQNVVHFLQTAECSTAITSKGDISLESSSQYCLALMSNWNTSGCLPWNVILYCTLGTLEDKTLYSEAGGKWGRMAFPTFHEHTLMSQLYVCVEIEYVQLMLQREMFILPFK